MVLLLQYLNTGEHPISAHQSFVYFGPPSIIRNSLYAAHSILRQMSEVCRPPYAGMRVRMPSRDPYPTYS